MTVKSKELTAIKNSLPLDNRIQMLGKSSREKGELEGVASTQPKIQPQTTNPT
ncbi:hypothetical protein THF5G08_190077 [Vibrio jasicida]|nr:hypothetical protein THF5G08_190077 [Vibrio jasicida]